MTNHIKTVVYRYLYRALGVVFVVSLIVFAFAHSVAPLGLKAAYSGSSMTVVKDVASPLTAGSAVAVSGAALGSVDRYTILESMRTSGALYYRVEPVAGEATIQTVRAQGVSSVVLSIPVLGWWVRAVLHPVGAMALIGIPLLTFAFDFLLLLSGTALVRKVRATARAVEGARRARQARREAMQEVEVYEEEEALELPAQPGLLARLKGVFTRERKDEQYDAQPAGDVGMTVHLSRHHYGV